MAALEPGRLSFKLGGLLGAISNPQAVSISISICTKPSSCSSYLHKRKVKYYKQFQCGFAPSSDSSTMLDLHSDADMSHVELKQPRMRIVTMDLAIVAELFMLR